MFESRPLIGIMLMASATCFFSLHDLTAKSLSQTFPVPMLVWARYSVHFLVMLVMLAPSMRLKLIITKRPLEHISRGLMLVITSCFGIAGFRHLPLAEATAVVFISPFIVLLLARWLLHEKITVSRWLAVIFGLFGVLLIARPGGVVSSQGLIFLVLAACTYAIYSIQTRQLSPSENSLTMLFYTALVGAVSMTLAIPFYWDSPIPNTVQILQIISMGVLSGIGQLLFIRAFRHASASTLSPFAYTQLIWAILLGWLFYDHLPDGLSIAGIAAITASSMSIALSERFKRRSAPDTDTAC